MTFIDEFLFRKNRIAKLKMMEELCQYELKILCILISGLLALIFIAFMFKH